MLPKMLKRENFEGVPELVNKVRTIMTSISLEGMVGDLMALKERPDSRPMLSGIKVPTLILHGVDDQLIPPQEAKDMHRGDPRSTTAANPQRRSPAQYGAACDLQRGSARFSV